MSLNACTVVSVSVSNAGQFQLLDEFCIIHGVHAAAVLQNPVDELAVADIVNKAGNHQIISVNGSTVADNVTLAVDIPQRNNGESSRRRTVKNCLALNVVLPDNLRVRTLIFQDSHIFILALDIVRISVQSGAERLAVINLPETDSGFQSAVILVINRDELGQVEAFNVVKVPESESNATVLCVGGNILHFFVKVFTKFCFVGFGLECNTIAQQIGNRLGGEVVVPI